MRTLLSFILVLLVAVSTAMHPVYFDKERLNNPDEQFSLHSGEGSSFAEYILPVQGLQGSNFEFKQFAPDFHLPDLSYEINSIGKEISLAKTAEFFEHTSLHLLIIFPFHTFW